MPDDDLLGLDDFPARSKEKLRYGDTDRQGHVNNAVFATFMETGRVEMFFGGDTGLSTEDTEFVIVRLELDFLAEVTWPGTVEIGTMVREIGNSSFKLFQLVFQNGKPVARSSAVIVQMDKNSRKSRPLSQDVRRKLETFQSVSSVA